MYPGFKAKFPAASQAVDDFKTANAALNKAKESTLRSSPSMLDQISHYDGLLAAAEACHKAAQGAQNECKAIIPALQQAVETAQKTQDTKFADANRADVQATKGMLARVTPLNAWSEAATVAKSAWLEAKAAAKAADDAEEAVRRLKSWEDLLNIVASKSHASAKRAEQTLQSWDYSPRGNALSSVWAERLFG